MPSHPHILLGEYCSLIPSATVDIEQSEAGKIPWRDQRPARMPVLHRDPILKSQGLRAGGTENPIVGFLPGHSIDFVDQSIPEKAHRCIVVVEGRSRGIGKSEAGRLITQMPESHLTILVAQVRIKILQAWLECHDRHVNIL